MQLKTLFDSEKDRAVSPVIGVILMVAITVILAAVIGTFVLGLGDDLQDTTPQASFNFDFDTSGNETVTITHESGDSIDAGNLNVTADSSYAWTTDSGFADGDSVSAGSSITVGVGDITSGTTWDGQTVRVIFDDGAGTTGTLGRTTAPS